MSEQQLTETPITEYRATEAALAELAQRYADVVYPVGTSTGMADARKARAELRDLRVSLEKTRKEIKEPALRRCQQIDSEAKRITGELSRLEDPIDAQIKKEEQRREDERRAREEAERQRVGAIHAAIAAFAEEAGRMVGQPSAVIAARIERVRAADISEDIFAEFVEQAEAAKAAALDTMEAQLQRQQEHEAEQERIRAERAELEELRRQQAERQAAEEAEAAERRRKADEEAAAERERQAAALRAQREAEEKRLAGERAEAERQRREEAERQRAELARQREEEEARLAEQREQLRREQEAAAAERARLEADALANVTLYDAAVSALEFLQAKGYGQEQVTRMLAAALEREEAPA